MTEPFEHEYATDRESAAEILHGLAEGVAAGAVHLESDGEEWTVDIPETFDLELEFESEEGESGLEVELEWPDESADTEGASEEEAEVSEADATSEPVADDDDAPDGATADEDATEESGVAEPAVGAAATNADSGRFELFEDKRGEWRWRLVHANGNVIATSGEGYTRKHNARKGLRSVMRNASGAVVTERSE